MDRATIRVRTKILAKSVLSENFGRVFFVIILEAITTAVLSYLFNGIAAKAFPNAVANIAGFNVYYAFIAITLIGEIMLIPLKLGVAEFILGLVRRKSPKIADIFLWYSDGEKLRRVLSYWGWTVFLSLVSIPLVTVPSDYLLGVVNDITAEAAAQLSGGAQQVVLPAGFINNTNILLSVGAILLYGIITVRLIAVPYVVADGRERNAFKAAVTSWKLMKGHFFEYIVFVLSFFLWGVGMVFTSFILAIYFVPYFRLSQLIFIEYARAEKDINAMPADEGN